jgi:hypothetical protein
MRLLHVQTLEIVEFPDNNIPKYTILSHTWGDEEVSFEGIQAGGAHGKADYQKPGNAARKRPLMDTSTSGSTRAA